MGRDGAVRCRCATHVHPYCSYPAPSILQSGYCTGWTSSQRLLWPPCMLIARRFVLTVGMLTAPHPQPAERLLHRLDFLTAAAVAALHVLLRLCPSLCVHPQCTCISFNPCCRSTAAQARPSIQWLLWPPYIAHPLHTCAHHCVLTLTVLILPCRAATSQAGLPDSGCCSYPQLHIQ
jgi:hypothetical protein